MKARGRPPTVTGRTEAVLAFVRKFHAEHGYAPTVREIAQGIGISSTSQVDLRLKELRAAGKLDFQNGLSRSIVVAPDSNVVLTAREMPPTLNIGHASGGNERMRIGADMMTAFDRLEAAAVRLTDSLDPKPGMSASEFQDQTAVCIKVNGWYWDLAALMDYAASAIEGVR